MRSLSLPRSFSTYIQSLVLALMLVIPSMLIGTSHAHATQTNTLYDFEGTDLSELLSNDFREAIVSPNYTYATSTGLAGSAAIDVTGVSNVWATRTTYSAPAIDETITIEGYFNNIGSGGYGGLGLSTRRTGGILNGTPKAVRGLGIVFHGGGGNFVSNAQNLQDLSWADGDMTDGWWFMRLEITGRADNLYDMTFEIYPSDSSGTLGPLKTTHTITDISNSDMTNAEAVRAYFGTSDERYGAVDNVAVEGTEIPEPVASVPFSGEGTAESPYQISSCSLLQAIDSDESFLDKYYILTTDIDCAATDPENPANEGSQWTDDKGFNPIGDLEFVGNNVNQGFTHMSFTGHFDGNNKKISNLYINRGINWSDPDGYYVGLFRTISAGAEVKNLGLENVSIYGEESSVGAVAGGLSGTLTNVYSTGNVTGGYRVGGLVGVHVANNSFPNSSPLVYTWNGTKYVYTNDVGSLLPKELNGLDLASIDRADLAPKDGKYLMKIGEEYNEIVYFDELKLLTFDHQPGYTIVEQLGRVSSLDQLRSVSNTPTHPLISCVDEKGVDCTSALSAYDDQWSYANKKGQYDPKNLRKSFILDFGDLSGTSSIQLVMRGARDYAASAEFPGNSARSIQVKDAQGKWVEIYNKSQLGSDGTPRLRVIDLTGKFLSNTYQVKVAFDTFNANYFAVDRSPQIPFTATTHSPERADLGYYGFTKIDRTHFYDHDYYEVRPLPELPFVNQYGNFTKYGNVTELLNAADDHFVVMRYGDQMSIEFPYVPPATEGTERSFILLNNVFYKHATYSDIGELGQSAAYLPYRGMTTYARDMAPYPATPENIEYQTTWNTRTYAGPFADAFRSGGSTIIGSHSSAHVEAMSGASGGLVGENRKEIRTSYFTGSVTGRNYAGGIAGFNFGATGLIHDVYASSTITGISHVGGIVGYNTGSIERAYSTGAVINDGYNTGGIAGYSESNDNAGISDSFSTSDIVANPEYDTGGIVGYGETGDTITNNFWFNNFEVGNGNSNAVQPTKVANAEYFQGFGLDTKSPFQGKWDFANVPVWYMHVGRYPDFVSGESAPQVRKSRTSGSRRAVTARTDVTTTPSQSPVVFTRNIDLGVSGDDVRELQKFLNAQGFVIAPSGPGSVGNETTIFGQLTRQALMRFQAANGIVPASGYFGPKTRAFIMNANTTPITPATSTAPQVTRDLRSGMTGDDVKALQALLIAQGFAIPNGATGTFGPQTAAALSAYQKKNSIIPATGAFGPKTRAQMKASGLTGLWW